MSELCPPVPLPFHLRHVGFREDSMGERWGGILLASGSLANVGPVDSRPFSPCGDVRGILAPSQSWPHSGVPVLRYRGVLAPSIVHKPKQVSSNVHEAQPDPSQWPPPRPAR